MSDLHLRVRRGRGAVAGAADGRPRAEGTRVQLAPARRLPGFTRFCSGDALSRVHADLPSGMNK